MIPTHYGFVDTWECDENDHMNIQFYAAALHEADAHLRLALDLPPYDRPDSQVQTQIRTDHIRFLSELRAADPFTVVSAVVAADETALTVFHEMRHTATGHPAATMVSTWQHTHAGVATSWPEATHTRAKRLTAPLPDHARPKSAGITATPHGITLSDTTAHIETMKGQIRADECGIAGTMTTTGMLSRFSNAAAHVFLNAGLAMDELLAAHRGIVALEYHLTYLAPLHAGDPFTVKTHTRTVSGKVIGIGHCVFNSQTEKLCMIAQLSVVLMDLNARKISPLSADERKGFEKFLWPYEAAAHARTIT